MAAQLQQTQLLLPCIVPGMDFSYSLQFQNLSIDLTTATRVYGQFRDAQSKTGNLLASLDSTGGTLTVNNANTITFSIPRATTGNFNSMASAFVDFEALIAGTWIYIPVQIQWPVTDSIVVSPS